MGVGEFIFHSQAIFNVIFIVIDLFVSILLIFKFGQSEKNISFV